MNEQRRKNQRGRGRGRIIFILSHGRGRGQDDNGSIYSNSQVLSPLFRVKYFFSLKHKINDISERCEGSLNSFTCFLDVV